MLASASAKASAVAAPLPAGAPPAFCRDALFDGVLAFPPALRELRTHRLVADGSLLPMDRASAAAATRHATAARFNQI